MKILGFNVAKAQLSYCLVEGPKSSASLLYYGREKFDPNQPLPHLANYFKQAFGEIIKKQKPDEMAYRLSLNAITKANIPYMHFSYGILNLIAHEEKITVRQTISNTFTAKALGITGDKFGICDKLLMPPKTKWDNNYRYAALAALVYIDG